MKSIKSKEQVLRDGFSCLTNGSIPDDIFNSYLNDVDGSGTLRLQFWCYDNMKGWCADWNTGIGIIEAVEQMYRTSIENGNLEMKCPKCNDGMVNEPNKPEKHECEFCDGSGVAHTSHTGDRDCEELKNIGFIQWYSGMEEYKIRNAYERYKREIEQGQP